MKSLLTVLATVFLFVSTSHSQDVTLRTERLVEGTLASDGVDGYSFRAGENDFVYVQVNQLTVDVVVRLFGPDGEQIIEVDGPARGLETINIETDEAGTYRVEVSPFEENEGDYTVLLKALEPVAADPKKRVDQLMTPYDDDMTPGAAIGVWKDGKSVFQKAYGMANLAHDIEWSVDTRTNIGSTSKQFTAFGILLLQKEGKLSLDDDVRTYIEELPDFGETITIRHLLTHTTGYREFLNLLSMGGRLIGQGDYIDRDEIIDIVQRQPALQNAPGAEFNYNNTAFGLAATIIERISEEDFDDWMDANVFAPLGLDDTQVRKSPHHIVMNSSMGYASDGEGWIEQTDINGSWGAGGIYTTLADLGAWANMAMDADGEYAELFESLATSYVLTDGDTTGYGLGLFVDEQRGLARHQHGGADIAHRSMLAFYPEINAVVTAQSNNAGFNAAVVFQIAEAFFEDYMEPEAEEAGDDAEFDPASFDPETFDDYAGQYALDAAPAFVLTFRRDGNRYYTQATGQQEFEIFPIAENEFELRVVDASLTFHRESDGSVNRLTLHQGGDQPATRVAEETWSPSVEDLADFTGRYFSEELEAFFTVVVVDSVLTMKHRRMADASLTSGAEDTFSGGGFSEVAFERDRNGQVIGFYVGNGRTRDVRFAKLD